MKGGGKRLTFILIIVLMITSISWASNVWVLNISSDSTHPNHELAIVTPVSDNLIVSQGSAQRIEGVGLYEISLGAPRFSDQLKIHILLTNPEGIRQALNNPNAFIDIAVWYPDENGTHTFQDIQVSKNIAEGRMSTERGSILLNPTVPGQSTLYILASIVVPGGAPPGAQIQLNQLEFYVDVRM